MPVSACALSFLHYTVPTHSCLSICMYTCARHRQGSAGGRTQVFLLGSGWPHLDTEIFSVSNLRSKSSFPCGDTIALPESNVKQSQQVAPTSSPGNKTKTQVPMFTILRTFHKSRIFFCLPRPLPDE